MAFVDGTITRYECPICKIGCRPKLITSKQGFSGFVYVHSEGIPMDINGYPGVCDNSGMELSEDKIRVVHSPNIVSNMFNPWSTK